MTPLDLLGGVLFGLGTVLMVRLCGWGGGLFIAGFSAVVFWQIMRD